MTDASANSEGPETSQAEAEIRRAMRSPRRRKFGVGAAIAAGVVVFSLLVWLAFSLGFERMRADLLITNTTALEDTPQVAFNAESQGWTMVRPADTVSGTGPEFGNVDGSIEAMCVFSWQTGMAEDSEMTGSESDAAATMALLDAAGFDGDPNNVVRVVSQSGQSIELMVVHSELHSGLDTMVAARTFAGSDDYLLFTMRCERTGELDQEILQETLFGVELELDVRD
ncbi:MAG: hypothetical protein ACTHXA_05455 [Gulosibacter sp.]|uniref:hypothetical protein n=1 Tax=Gulosibacter sp. TaxID=2817531 RepID=UPI003F8F33AD